MTKESKRSTPISPYTGERPSVLILQRILPPYRLKLFEKLARSQKFDLTLAYGDAPRGSGLESIKQVDGIRTQRLVNLTPNKEERFVWQKGALQLCRSGQFDLIIAEFNPRVISTLLAAVFAPQRRFKLIWWGHGIRPHSGKREIAVYRWLAGKADATLFYSDDGAQRMLEQGLPKEKAFVAWNSIDTDEIFQLATGFDMTQRNTVLYIGRLIPEKKVDLLMRGFAAAVTRLRPATRLAIVGDGPDREKLEALAVDLGIAEHTDFVGSLYTQADLATWFNRSFISVSPGYIGLSAIHSLAYGVPMLVADNEPHSPEIAAIEANSNSLFFRHDDPAALAGCLADLEHDAERLTLMSTAGRQTIQRRFSIASMVTVFEEAVCYARQRSAA